MEMRVLDNDILKLILQVIPPALTLLTAVVSLYLVPQLKARKELDTEEKRKRVLEATKFWVDMAVRSAEQIFKDIPKSGADKKEYVLKFLKEKGIDMSLDDLNILIESAVKELELLEKNFIV